MGKRRKRQAERPPSTEELLTEQVSKLLAAKTITPMQVYELLLMGHKCYRSGMGLQGGTVWEGILDAFRDHERYYLSPGQMAVLHGRARPDPEDHEHLERVDT